MWKNVKKKHLQIKSTRWRNRLDLLMQIDSHYVQQPPGSRSSNFEGTTKKCCKITPLFNRKHTTKHGWFSHAECSHWPQWVCCIGFCIPFASYLSPFFCFDLTLRLLVLFYLGSLLREAFKSINVNWCQFGKNKSKVWYKRKKHVSDLHIIC